jgi:hypothetical protein
MNAVMVKAVIKANAIIDIVVFGFIDFVICWYWFQCFAFLIRRSLPRPREIPSLPTGRLLGERSRTFGS